MAAIVLRFRLSTTVATRPENLLSPIGTWPSFGREYIARQIGCIISRRVWMGSPKRYTPGYPVSPTGRIYTPSRCDLYRICHIVREQVRGAECHLLPRLGCSARSVRRAIWAVISMDIPPGARLRMRSRRTDRRAQVRLCRWLYNTSHLLQGKEKRPDVRMSTNIDWSSTFAIVQHCYVCGDVPTF